MAFRFDSSFRVRLLALPALLFRRGGADGGGAGRKRGGRLEFHDHRPYVPGDDPRDLDWSLYLRSGDLAIKEYARDDAIDVTVVLDRSASMGPEGGGKDRIAREVAAGLAYTALASGSPVALGFLGEGGQVTLGRWRSPRRLDALLSVLEGLGEPSGRTWLDGLQTLPPASAAGRATLVLSDFLADPLPAAGCVALARGAGTGCLLQLVAASERRPALAGALTLRDPDTGARLAAPDGLALERAYAAELERHLEAVGDLARRHGLGHLVFDDDAPFESTVLRCLGGERPT